MIVKLTIGPFEYKRIDDLSVATLFGKQIYACVRGKSYTDQPGKETVDKELPTPVSLTTVAQPVSQPNEQLSLIAWERYPWANWRSQDKDGSWWFWAEKPECRATFWANKRCDDRAEARLAYHAPKGSTVSNWWDTLEARPK